MISIATAQPLIARPVVTMSRARSFPRWRWSMRKPITASSWRSFRRRLWFPCGAGSHTTPAEAADSCHAAIFRFGRAPAVDERNDLVHGDAAESADVDRLEFAGRHQLVQRAAPDAE